MAEEWSWARRMAQPFLENLAETDLSGSAILDILRGEGLGYRMTDFFEDLRGLRDQIRYQSLVERLPLEAFVPRTWMREIDPQLWHISESHRAELRVLFEDPETGEITTEYYSPGMPRHMSAEETLAYAEETYPWAAYGEGRQLSEIELIGWSHRAGAPY